MKFLPMLLTGIFAISILLFGIRANNVKLLYIDEDLRTKAKSSLDIAAAEQGWLLSDFIIYKVTPEAVQFIYKRHSRLAFDLDCFQVLLSDSSVSPCTE